MDGFIIIGNSNAITYKEFFPFIKNGQVWLGRTLFTGKMPFFKVKEDYCLQNDRYERRADGLYKQVNSICWFTNVPNDLGKINLPLYKDWNRDSNEYPKYDNYDAIEVGRIADFPIGYEGVAGVPITALKYLNSDGYLHLDENGKDVQFEIVEFRKGNDDKDLAINGKKTYFRVLIRKRKDKDKTTMTDFIIIGNTNAVTYKEIFPLFKDNKVRLGYSTVKTFNTKDGTKEFGNVGWFSTFPVKKKTLTLTSTYDPDKYPVYDNYPAINVDRVKDIPRDYDGVMGVPVTILNYDLKYIEIVGFGGDELDKKVFEEYLKQGHKTHYSKSLLIYKKDNKWFMPFSRILIRRTDILNNKNE